MPCPKKRARLLLERGRVVVMRRYPFTIRLSDRVGGEAQEVRIKLDPGSKTTRNAVAAHAQCAFHGALQGTVLPVEASSGGRPKYNCCRFGIPKTRALDAACAGKIETLNGWRIPTLGSKATRRGSYCQTRLDAYGFQRGYCDRKEACGFKTGKKSRTFIGRVVPGINVRHCTHLRSSDGYSYRRPSFLPTDKSGAIWRGTIR